MQASTSPPKAVVVDRSSLRLLRIGGIDIRLDWSLIVIFVLVVVSLATGILQAWHPGWTPLQRWATAALAGVLFFASILLHELAHATVARMYGIEVPRITLFMFGGMAEMRTEASTPGQELAIAIVGPLTSFFIGIVCMVIGTSLAPSFTEQLVDDPVAAFASLGVLSTLMLWLGPINLLLGAFNLVPGFPLDGGRVLRSILWAATGDLLKATRWASLAGQLVAWGLIAWGVLQTFTGNLGGLWLVLIGWFLHGAARSSHLELKIRNALQGVVVRDLMRTHFEQVDENVPLEFFVKEQLLRGGQSLWPVTRQGRAVGLVTLDVIAGLPEEERHHKTVGQVMLPLQGQLAPDLDGREAMRSIAVADVEALPVVERGQLVGLLHRADLVRWLVLHEAVPTPS